MVVARLGNCRVLMWLGARHRFVVAGNLPARCRARQHGRGRISWQPGFRS